MLQKLRWLAAFPVALAVGVILTLVQISLNNASGGPATSALGPAIFGLAALSAGLVAPRRKGIVALVAGLLLLVPSVISISETRSKLGSENMLPYLVFVACLAGVGLATLLCAVLDRRAEVRRNASGQAS